MVIWSRHGDWLTFSWPGNQVQLPCMKLGRLGLCMARLLEAWSKMWPSRIGRICCKKPAKVYRARILWRVGCCAGVVVGVRQTSVQLRTRFVELVCGKWLGHSRVETVAHNAGVKQIALYYRTSFQSWACIWHLSAVVWASICGSIFFKLAPNITGVLVLSKLPVHMRWFLLSVPAFYSQFLFCTNFTLT